MTEALLIALTMLGTFWGLAVLLWVPARFIEPEWAGSVWTFPVRMYAELLGDAFGKRP